MTALFLVSLLTALFTGGNAAIGFDASQALSVSTLTCLKNTGYSFFIARVFHSYGAIDTTGIQNIKNAYTAGITSADGYLFPCLDVKCGNGSSQVMTTIAGLKAAGANIGTLWLDIENYHWPNDLTHNRQFILDMVSMAEKMNVKVGVYSTSYFWRDIVGSDFTALSRLPLWWANYNNKQSFEGFTSFGGWTTPAIHQYTDKPTATCGATLDLNWHP